LSIIEAYFSSGVGNTVRKNNLSAS
jgi:hypothetical protein